MSNERIVLKPDDLEGTVRQIAAVWDLDEDSLEVLRQTLALFSRPITLVVDEASVVYYSETPLIDHFTFNMQTDELILLSRDPLTLIDALVEMAMYVAGFATLLGAEDQWKVEFAIGAWKPVRNRIKRQLGVPVLDEPLWIVGLPPNPEDGVLNDQHPFRMLVSQLDMASFTQMVRLAARDDVEVNFPNGTDPRVIEVYIRMKTAMYQVADELTLDDWREFNRRLLHCIQDLEEAYHPCDLPVPAWWQRMLLAQDEASLDEQRPTSDYEPPQNKPRWNPFETYLEELFSEEDADYWE